MKTFLNILLLVGNSGFISLLLLKFRLSFDEWLIISFLLGGLYTRLQIDKADLENKIFEIKELLKNKNE